MNDKPLYPLNALVILLDGYVMRVVHAERDGTGGWRYWLSHFHGQGGSHFCAEDEIALQATVDWRGLRFPSLVERTEQQP